MSIGLAVALVVIGRAVECWNVGSSGGWFGYAPNTDAVYIGPDTFLHRHGIPRLFLWLFLITVWIVISSWLFRSPEPDSSTPGVSEE